MNIYTFKLSKKNENHAKGVWIIVKLFIMKFYIYIILILEGKKFVHIFLLFCKIIFLSKMSIFCQMSK